MFIQIYKKITNYFIIDHKIICTILNTERVDRVIGTALMTGAMSLNCIVGMTMMHPVEWHARKPEDVRAERQREKEERKLRGIVLSDRRYSDVVRTPAKTRWSSLTSLKGESGKQVPLLIETLKVSFARCSDPVTVVVASAQEILKETYLREKAVL